MAALANGKLLVTTASEETDEVWQTTPAVHLINSYEPAEIAKAVDRVLSEPGRLLRGASEAKRFYRQNFSIDQTVSALQRAGKWTEPAFSGATPDLPHP